MLSLLKNTQIRSNRARSGRVTTSSREGGSGKHHRGRARAHTHVMPHGERIEFLMASVYSHGRRQEVRDASTRCSRINASARNFRLRTTNCNWHKDIKFLRDLASERKIYVLYVLYVYKKIFIYFQILFFFNFKLKKNFITYKIIIFKILNRV